MITITIMVITIIITTIIIIIMKEEYKQMKHDNVAKILHWKLFEKWGFNTAEKFRKSFKI